MHACRNKINHRSHEEQEQANGQNIKLSQRKDKDTG
jgi:hypothetical protein